MKVCRACNRSFDPKVRVVPVVQTEAIRKINRRMEQGYCWYCAAGMAPMLTTRGGVERAIKGR